MGGADQAGQDDVRQGLGGAGVAGVQGVPSSNLVRLTLVAAYHLVRQSLGNKKVRLFKHTIYKLFKE